MNVFTLSPSIDENKNIICSNTQHDKNHKIVQKWGETNLEYSLINQSSNWEAEYNQENTNHCKKQGPQMENKINDDKKKRKNGECKVTIYKFIYFLLIDCIWKNRKFYSIGILLIKFFD